MTARIALVIGIGNGEYEHALPLSAPRGDAVLMGARLEALEFTVLSGYDCTYATFRSRVDDFLDRLRPETLAVFYYSGHGAATAGAANHILPVDAEVVDPRDLGRVTIPLDDLLAEMRKRAGVSLLFLDACRDDPFRNAGARLGTKGVLVQQPGLAPVRKKQLSQALIGFAAEQGQTALDAPEGQRSPFTAALARLIGTEGQEIHDLMKAVRLEVLDKTEGRQVPWTNDALTEDVVLRPAKGAAPVVPDRPHDPAPEAVSSEPRPPLAEAPERAGLQEHGPQGMAPDLSRPQLMDAKPLIPDPPRSEPGSASSSTGSRVGSALGWIVRLALGAVPVLLGVLLVSGGNTVICALPFSGGLGQCQVVIKPNPDGPEVLTGQVATDVAAIPALGASDAGTRTKTAQQLVTDLRDGGLAAKDQKALAAALLRQAQPDQISALAPPGPYNLLYVLTQIPPANWQADDWTDNLAAAHSAYTGFIASASAGPAAGALVGSSTLIVTALPAGTKTQNYVKQFAKAIGYVDRSALTVDFQFGGRTRIQAEALRTRLLTSEWKIAGSEQVAAASGLHEVRYGNPDLWAMARLLARDAAEASGHAVKVVPLLPAIKPDHLELWIGQ
jgi:hypothetical protein